MRAPPDAATLAAMWSLDRSVDFLNHGSFGACPLPVLEEQARLRCLMEAQLYNSMAQYERLGDALAAALAGAGLN